MPLNKGLKISIIETPYGIKTTVHRFKQRYEVTEARTVRHDMYLRRRYLLWRNVQDKKYPVSKHWGQLSWMLSWRIGSMWNKRSIKLRVVHRTIGRTSALKPKLCTGVVVSFSFSGWSETESTWYVGHCCPIIPASDDRWWLWSSWWNEDWQRKPKYSEETYPSATLSTTNPTWPDLGSNPGRRDGKPATNLLSYGTAHKCSKVYAYVCIHGGELIWLRWGLNLIFSRG
jgi:hypothetical protein